ncbi:MAG TPA: hypothetical protein VER76_01880 [Pyrinomonadaceae bacterium]|nr:hypothetical protein [Pyrinomonadaceae bacterium]
MSNKDEVKLSSEDKDKPLSRVQTYLAEAKTCVILLRELLIEVKELAVVIALTAFFVWGVIELFNKLH